MVPRFLKRRWSKTPHELQLSAQKVFAWPSCEAKGAFEVSTWPFALGFLGEAGLGSSVLESSPKWLRSQTQAALEIEVNESNLVQGYRTKWELSPIPPCSQITTVAHGGGVSENGVPWVPSKKDTPTWQYCAERNMLCFFSATPKHPSDKLTQHEGHLPFASLVWPLKKENVSL